MFFNYILTMTKKKSHLQFMIMLSQNPNQNVQNFGQKPQGPQLLVSALGQL